MANPKESVSSSRQPTTRESSSFHCAFPPSMEITQPPFEPYSLFSHAKPQSKEKNPEPAIILKVKTEEDDEESLISTELTLKYGYNISTKKPTTGNITTELKLYNDSFFSDEKRKKKKSISDDFLVSYRIGLMKHYYKPEEIKEEKRLGISTELKLYNDPWKIKKKLTESDIDGSSRVLLTTQSVRTHVIPMLGPVRAREIETNAGLRVTIWDVDSDSEHGLTLKRWVTTGSYVLINNWRQEFVRRRKLKERDKIGFFWDRYSSRFCFRLLKRAVAKGKVKHS